MFKLLNLSNNSLKIFWEWTYENCSKEWCRENIYKHVFQPFLVRKTAALREHKPYAIFYSCHSSRPLANKRELCGSGCSTHILVVEPTEMRVSRDSSGPLEPQLHCFWPVWAYLGAMHEAWRETSHIENTTHTQNIYTDYILILNRH